MSDGLPRLLPTDPKNLLSVDARKRIHRAIIEADNYVWEAEVAIEKRGMDRFGPKAYSLRNEANFKKATAALSVYRREFSRIDIPERKFREIMREEIESASYSLELSDVQRRFLENKFFFPEEKAIQPRRSTTLKASPATEAKSDLEEQKHVKKIAFKIKTDPKALPDYYYAIFSDEKIKIRDLCWAAGQHYREWKRWLAEQLKAGSTPDLAFRRILSSGKRPLEFNKRPRPKGWE